MAWLLEELIADQHGLERMGECEGYDLKDKAGGHWEVRCCTRGGVYFCSSGDAGKGRKFDILGYLAKQKSLAGWIVADIETFQRVPYWVIPRVVVETWHGQHKLGAGTKVSRAKFIDLIRNTLVSKVQFAA